MKIGVFDSGVGGLSVARAVERALPEYQVIFRNDAAHMPYGTKSPEQLLGYVVPLLQGLVRDGCSIIIIACNTVSTTLIAELRLAISVPLIAVEPMVKPAAKLTKSGVIAVCATPGTLRSDRYKELKQLYASNIKVVEPDCRSWARMIEDRRLDEALIADEITDALTLGADVIVLGCTHYHWIRDVIVTVAAGRAEVLQPEEAIIRQLRKQITLLQKG